MAYYHPLLFRYARRIVANEPAADKLVKQVLEEQYKIDQLKPSVGLRLLLKTDVRNRCYYIKQVQLFNRPPLKVPERKYEKQSTKNTGEQVLL